MVDCYLRNEKQMGGEAEAEEGAGDAYSCAISAQKRGRHFAFLRPVS